MTASAALTMVMLGSAGGMDSSGKIITAAAPT
jgi:hypothetical protein